MGRERAFDAMRHCYLARLGQVHTNGVPSGVSLCSTNSRQPFLMGELLTHLGHPYDCLTL